MCVAEEVPECREICKGLDDERVASIWTYSRARARINSQILYPLKSVCMAEFAALLHTFLVAKSVSTDARGFGPLSFD